MPQQLFGKNISISGVHCFALHCFALLCFAKPGARGWEQSRIFEIENKMWLRQSPQQLVGAISKHFDFGGALLCFAFLCQAGGPGFAKNKAIPKSQKKWLRQMPQQLFMKISQHLDFGGALYCFVLHYFAKPGGWGWGQMSFAIIKT